MKRLVKAALHGGGLVQIDVPKTIERYNDALLRLGAEPTSLKEFHIDGVGWSPEVAEECGDTDYLQHGVANPFAVIVTPSQAYRPIYFPVHSFERRLMRMFFDEHVREIADITTGEALALDLDQGVSSYRSVLDLLRVRDVTVRPIQGAFMEAGAEQETLVEKFLGSDDTWADPEFRKLIIESGKKHGDLRGRRLSIPEWVFEGEQSFYTRALGGVYLFRTEDVRPIVIVENSDALVEKDGVFVQSVDDHEYIIEHLLDVGLFKIDTSWYQSNANVLEERLKALMMQQIAHEDPDLDLSTVTSAHCKRWLATEAESPDLLLELEEIVSRLRNGDRIGNCSRAASLFLVHPNGQLPQDVQSILWHLVCRLQPHVADLVRLYAVDKNGFLHRYRTWNNNLREWAVAQIAPVYRPHMHQK